MGKCREIKDDFKKIDDFIDKTLKGVTSSKTSLNIYGDKDENAGIKRENLRFYLKKMRTLNPSRLFVGLAPGINGCFWTGIPFTSEAVISKNKESDDENSFFKEFKKFDIPYQCQTINKDPQYEPTSSTVWACLNQLSEKDLPLLWNIYPFYLWKDGKNNRTPNTKECEGGAKILLELLDYFDIKEIYPVGKKTEETLIEELPVVIKMKKEDFVELKIEIKNYIVRIPYINHPSPISCNIKNTTQTNQKSTGQKEFIKRFDDIYEIPPKTPEELDKFIERIKESKPKNKKKQKNKN